MKRILLGTLALVVCVFALLGTMGITAHAATVVVEGDCSAYGSSVYYVLDSDGLLTITGTGKIGTSWGTPVWNDYDASIKKVVIGSGITEICNSAFEDCVNLTSVEIPATVTAIGSNAFDGCTKLGTVEIPNSITSIGS